AVVIATAAGGSSGATAAVVAAATAPTTTTVTEQIERERLGRDTQETDRQHGGQHTALHGTDSLDGPTRADGNGNNLSPEPPAPRCSWHLRQAETVTADDDQHRSAGSRRAIVNAGCPALLVGRVAKKFTKLPGRLI